MSERLLSLRGLRVWDAGFWVEGLRFRGFRIYGLAYIRFLIQGFGVWEVEKKMESTIGSFGLVRSGK